MKGRVGVPVAVVVIAAVVGVVVRVVAEAAVPAAAAMVIAAVGVLRAAAVVGLWEGLSYFLAGKVWVGERREKVDQGWGMGPLHPHPLPPHPLQGLLPPLVGGTVMPPVWLWGTHSHTPAAVAVL